MSNSEDKEKLINELYKGCPEYVKKVLNPVQYAYLKFYEECKDKVKAYQETHEGTSWLNCTKNWKRFDRRVRAKALDFYNMVQENVEKKSISIKENTYMQALKDTGGNKIEAIEKVSDASTNASKYRAIKKIEDSISVKDPDWRLKLTGEFKPGKYFRNLDELATSSWSDETRRKATNDMLSYLGFTQTSAASLDPRRTERSALDSDIDRILQINVTIDNNKCTETEHKIIDID